MSKDINQRTLCNIPCNRCSCTSYTYCLSEIEKGVYRLNCKDCGRLIEGDRAEEILRDCGIISDKGKELLKMSFLEIMKQLKEEFKMDFSSFSDHYGLISLVVLYIINQKILGIQKGELTPFRLELLRGLQSAVGNFSPPDYFSYLDYLTRSSIWDGFCYKVIYNHLKDHVTDMLEFRLDENGTVVNVTKVREFVDIYIRWIKKWKEQNPFKPYADNTENNRKFLSDATEFLNSVKEEYNLSENDILFYTGTTQEYQQSIEIPPANIRMFIPQIQQRVIIGEEEYVDEIKRLDKEIEEIPSGYQQPTDEEISHKGSKFDALTVYAHFFNYSIDWYVLSWDRENGIINSYMIGQGKDHFISSLGDTFLNDLTTAKTIEMDFYWERQSLAQALYDKYPEDFPKPSGK